MTSTHSYVQSHPGTGALDASALTHGFQLAFYVLTALAVAGALVAAIFVEPQPRPAEVEPLGSEAVATLEEAA